MKTKLILAVLFALNLVKVSAADFAPSSITNLDVAIIVRNGAVPFMTCGSYRFITNPTGTNYVIRNNCGDQLSTGNYKYTKLSTNTAKIVFNDSLTGRGNSQAIVFQSPLCGSHYLTNSLYHGWQGGKFVFMNRMK